MITRDEISKVLKNEFERQKLAQAEKQKDEKYKWNLAENEFVANLEYCKNEVMGDLTFDQIHQEGGEDRGSNYFFVHKVSRGEESVLISISGYYNSYDGTEYYDQLDNFKFVKPVEKTIITYQEVE